MNISDERYERMILMIFFETLTILAFVMFYGKLKSGIQVLIFFEALAFFQLPFISFIQNDFLAARPTLVEKLIKWGIRLFIATIVVGIFIIIFIIDWRAGIVGTSITAIVSIIQMEKNRGV